MRMKEIDLLLQELEGEYMYDKSWEEYLRDELGKDSPEYAYLKDFHKDSEIEIIEEDILRILER